MAYDFISASIRFFSLFMMPEWILTLVVGSRSMGVSIIMSRYFLCPRYYPDDFSYDITADSQGGVLKTGSLEEYVAGELK